MDDVANLWSALGDLERQVARGSQFTQAILQRGTVRLDETETVVAALLDALMARGVVAPGDLGVEDGAAPTSEPAERGADSEVGAQPETVRWPSIALRVDPVDEAGNVGGEVTVDCDARMPVCKAVCCKLRFALTPEEVDTAKVKWDIGHPYVIRQDSAGSCIHNEGATGRCGVYEDRPAVCRKYSCAGDPRIWTDFDGMVLNEEWIAAHLGPRVIRVDDVMVPPPPG